MNVSVARRMMILTIVASCLSRLFFFNDTATTEIYPLSLHDALPIWNPCAVCSGKIQNRQIAMLMSHRCPERELHVNRHGDCNRKRSNWRKLSCSSRSGQRCEDRKSTRLNSSHVSISYAVFCLKKKKK